MKTSRFFTAIGLITAIWFSACTNDEPMNPNALPEGKYPLEIASVTMSVESSSEPWSANAPQTRVTENADGMSSTWEWDGTERIGVQLYADDDDVATYTLNADKTLTPDKTLYWKNKEQTTVMAWYPVETEVSLANQKDKLAYVLKGSGTGNYNTPVALGFTHALAKVRVLLNGTQAGQVETVEVYGYTTCTNNEGVPIAGSTQGWLKMKNTTYADGTECWEANVVPGNITLDNFVRINGQTATVNDGFPTTLDASTMYTIDLTVGEEITVITADNCDNISGSDNYVVSGNFGQTITVTDGSPTIYMENANINVGNGNAIHIQGGNPTIHVQGTSSIFSSDGAGIYVAEGCTVTITGSSREDKLTVTGNEGSSGIGGYVIDDSNFQSANSGNINIKNVTLYAYSSSLSDMGTVSPGIGSTGSATCQSITIDNAAVYAYGCGFSSMSAPAIGNGIDWIENTASATPTVTISNNSEVHAHRGESDGRSFADYIGRAGILASPYSDVKASVDATSVVYKYTGYGNTPDQ